MIALAAALLLSAPPQPPVAVMPFKNLGGEPSLDWMAGGIADTMISDLRREKVAVVERDQIARALGEILATGGSGEDPSAAAKIGRLVGARTVVVGGYQQAGKQLRINARFVEVETGVVQEAAKATGAASDPFAVQDQVVAQLLGRAPPARKTGAKTPEAYRLYARAANTASDVDRAPLLKKAIEIDPDFVYAKDALDALERRVVALSEARDKDAITHEAGLRAVALDAKKPAGARAQAANELLNSLMQGRRYHRLLVDAAALDGTDLTLPVGGFRIAESAAFGLVLANSGLRRLDRSLQAGERFLKEFPRSNYFGSVRVMIETDLKEKQARAAAPEKEKAKLDELFAKEAAMPAGSLGRANAELAVCLHAQMNKLPDLAITRCRAIHERYRDHERPELRTIARDAAVHEMRARIDLGQVVEARTLAATLLAAKSDDEAAMRSRSLLQGLATDSPEDAR